MNSNLKIHLLVNETAGNGRAKKILDRMVLLLIKENITFDVKKSAFAGEAIQLAQSYADQMHLKNETLIVIGGDGSLNEVLNGIKRSQNPLTPFAYLPAGTGNDFGRAANLSSDPQNLLHNIEQHIFNPTLTDCVSLRLPEFGEQTYYFANSFGIGFDALVNHLSNISNLKKLLNKLNEGKLIYGLHILSALYKQDTFSVDLEADGKRWHYNEAFLVTTTNHPYLGGGIPLLPRARIDSHKIDTVIVEKDSLKKLIKLLLNLLKDGSHVNDPQFHYIEADKITIETSQKEFAQVDGEQIKKQSFKLKFAVDQFVLYR